MHFTSLLFWLVILMGCEPAPPSELVTPAPPLRIALVMKTLTNPFFVQMERGARRAENEFDIQLIVRTTAQETSVEQQVSIIETLINDRVDAIVIAPADSLRVIPILKLAQDQNIVIVNIDNLLDPTFSELHGLHPIPFISVDNELGAYKSARYLVEQFPFETAVKAAILEGIVTAQNGLDRTAGARRAFDEAPNVELVATASANWKIDEGYAVTAELLSQHPDINAIFAANDMMALGALQYLRDNALDHVKIASFDALAETREAIRSGQLVATIDQQAAEQGYLGVLTALKLLKEKEAIMAAVTFVESKLVTVVQISSLGTQ